MSDERLLELIEKNDKYYILGFIKGIKTNYEILKEENERLKQTIEENTILVEDENGNYQEINIDTLKIIEQNQELKEKIEKIREIVENSDWRLDDVHDLIDGYDEIVKILKEVK